MAMYAKVRRLFYREKLSIHEIRRQASLSRNTIKKRVCITEGVTPKYARTKNVGKLTTFEVQLQLALRADSHRPKRDRRTGLMHYEALKAAGFTVSYSTVNRCIQRWHGDAAKVASTAAFVPLEFALWEAFQFDRSEEHLVIGGLPRKNF